jgi:hypothetical protein
MSKNDPAQTDGKSGHLTRKAVVDSERSKRLSAVSDSSITVKKAREGGMS